MDDEKAMLDKLGLECAYPEDGCCGMAGSFGFERGHYEVSQAVGERVLLPKVREAPKDELLIANGFSYIEQVRQGTDRRPLHLAQVIQMALHEDPVGPAGPYPERSYPLARPEAAQPSAAAVGLLAGTTVLGGFLLGRWLKRRWQHANEALKRTTGEDVRPGLRDGRRGDEELAGVYAGEAAGGEPLHGDRRLP
jgi:hypothetical protein